jgi:hypothetical protein
MRTPKNTAQSDRRAVPRRQVSDETTEMVGVPSRRIRAPADALVVWALVVEDLIPKNAVPLFHGLSDFGAREIFDRVQYSRSCQPMLLRHPAFQAQGDGRRHKCASWRQGRCQGCGWRTNFVCLSHRPTPLTAARLPKMIEMIYRDMGRLVSHPWNPGPRNPD